MENRKTYNKNYSNKLNINNKQKEKEEDTPIMTLLYEGIVNLFNSEEKEKKSQKIPKLNNTIKYQYCNCKITYNKSYCDNIYYLMKMLKNDISSKKNKILYENLLKVHEDSLDVNGDNLRQIKKDLSRTYPSNTIFKDDRILSKLKNVLRAFSNYDNSIKYFQGMNFIVGFFLYHCDEYIAFWLFVALLEEYDLRPIFMQNFPGLKLHVKRIEIILQKEYQNIWNTFVKFGVKVEIFMVEWVFSLFSSLIPLELQMDFYKGFFSQGWIFFYKMCISSILNLNGAYFEVDEIYMALKCGKNDEKKKEKEIWENWKKIIQNAYNLKIKTDVMSLDT